jgi:NADH:ubiquinone oxidoreductase subunit 4 (subunit M)
VSGSLMECLGVSGMVLCSAMAFLQGDIKGLIAFSSVCHMNFSLVVLCLKPVESKLFGVLVMFSHALSSSLIFWVGGMMFHLSFSRQLLSVCGLQQLSLSLCLAVFFVCVSNFGVPPFLSFLSEYLFVGVIFSSFCLGWCLILFYLMLACYFSLFCFHSVRWERKSSCLNHFALDELRCVVGLTLLLDLFLVRVVS